MSFSCGDDTDCIHLTEEGGQLVATLIVSPAEGNGLQCTPDGLWAPGGALEGTNLPAAPEDGMIVYYVADDDDGVIWPFRYRAVSSSIYKWEHIGGVPLLKKVTTGEALTGAASAGYVNLAAGTVGPTVVAPLAGDYMVHVDAMIDGAEDGTKTSASVKIGTTAAVDDNDIANYTTRYTSVSRLLRINAIGAGKNIRLQYAKGSDDNDAGFAHRALAVWPVRCKRT